MTDEYLLKRIWGTIPRLKFTKQFPELVRSFTFEKLQHQYHEWKNANPELVKTMSENPTLRPLFYFIVKGGEVGIRFNGFSGKKLT